LALGASIDAHQVIPGNALHQALMNYCDELSLRLAAWVQARGIASALPQLGALHQTWRVSSRQ